MPEEAIVAVLESTGFKRTKFLPMVYPKNKKALDCQGLFICT
jgi:hypothetical protein